MTVIMFLLRLEFSRLWLLTVILSVATTEAIVATMDLCLNGKVTSDYLLTGLVSNCIIY